MFKKPGFAARNMVSVCDVILECAQADGLSLVAMV